MTTISIEIPGELVSRLDEIARAKQISRVALLREALEEMLESQTLETPRSLFERSADLCGKGCSGLGDLASNSRHLDGFSS
jgi:hypothetical protein